MKRIEFLENLKTELYKLLKSGERCYFDVDKAPDETKFSDYMENYIKMKPDYKGDSWFSYDVEEFYIELNKSLPVKVRNIFTNNTFVDYISNLNYSDFELACIVLMKKFLGSTIVSENKGSRDDGIDFYGKYNAIDESESNFFDIPAWYIGQAKYYEKNPIKTNLLRELIGTVELAKLRMWSIEGRYKDIDIKHSDQVIPVFITSSRFSYDSQVIANKYMIKLLDDIDLIFWLTLKFEGDLDNFKNELADLKAHSVKSS